MGKVFLCRSRDWFLLSRLLYEGKMTNSLICFIPVQLFEALGKFFISDCSEISVADELVLFSDIGKWTRSFDRYWPRWLMRSVTLTQLLLRYFLKHFTDDVHDRLLLSTVITEKRVIWHIRNLHFKSRMSRLMPNKMMSYLVWIGSIKRHYWL